MDNDQCCIGDNFYAYSRDTSYVRDKSILGFRIKQQCEHIELYNEYNIQCRFSPIDNHSGRSSHRCNIVYEYS